MNDIEAEVKQRLAEVIDPETGLSILRMNLIHDLTVTPDGSVSLVFRPSSPVCPMAYALANSIKKKIEAIENIDVIDIKVENFERAEHLQSLLKS
jgi:metal-sulfur cluster biosynthetic enzyme